jgi:hypothetical protein
VAEKFHSMSTNTELKARKIKVKHVMWLHQTCVAVIAFMATRNTQDRPVDHSKPDFKSTSEISSTETTKPSPNIY